LVLSVLIAFLYGGVFHLFFGMRLWQLPVYLVGSLVGFLVGFAVGSVFGVEWIRLGAVPLAASSLGAFGVLFVCWFFSTPFARRPPSQ
jgi:hypothetical protein